MSFVDSIDSILKNADIIEYNNSSKFVMMSDCHRGDGNLGDNFFKNQDIYYYALKYYYKNNYTYIELGDGDELWEVSKITDIMETYSNIFDILSEFHKKKRLYFIYGNHDMVKKNNKFVEHKCRSYFNRDKEKNISLFENIKIHEALVLKEKERDNNILLIHGHQGDFINYKLWRVTRFFVRYIWRMLEIYGVNDPTSAAKNYKRKKSIEKKFIEWAKERKTLVVVGHTHRPMFPEVGEVPYFNDGSCIHPRCITAIEINNGCIQLVKWCISAREDGTLAIIRSVLSGPRKIRDYFEKLN